MTIYSKEIQVSVEKAYELFGEITVIERMEIAEEFFERHPYSEKIEFIDGMSIRR